MTSLTWRRRSALRTLVAAGAAIALIGTGAITAQAAEVEAATASLSGTITDVATGEGIDGASIVVLGADGSEAGEALTGSAGGYTVSGLPEGGYTVSVSAAPTYEPVFWPRASSPAAAETIILAAGETRVGVDLALTQAHAEALGSDSPEGDQPSQAETAGTEPIQPEAEQAPLAETARTEPVQPDEADQLSVAAAEATSSAGAITGTVVRSDTGAPLEGIAVSAHSQDFLGPQGNAVTDAMGNYIVVGLPAGEYIVEFGGAWYADHIFVHEYWGGSYESAGPLVSVTEGATTTGIDASLEVGGTISGVVTDAATGLPLAGVTVGIDRSSGGLPTTAADGRYTLVGLPPGDYRVRFDLWSPEPPYGSVYLTEYWDDAHDYGTATRVSVGLGSSLTGIDAALDRPASISGVVTYEGSGAPIDGAWVTASSETGASGRAHVEADGSYTLADLAPGDYRVYFSTDAAGDAIAEYWDGAHDYGSASIIRLSAGETRTGVDASLEEGTSISGRVTREDTGAPVADVYVSAVDSELGYGVGVQTSSDGTYTIGGLIRGNYTVTFTPWNSPDLSAEYWDGAAEAADATSIAVRGGEPTANIDASLQRSASITGQVRFGGAPFTGADVELRAEKRDGTVVRHGYLWGGTSDGRYVIGGLSAGEYLVYASPSPKNNAAAQYYRGAPTASEATPITVRVGQETSGVDFDLAPGINITGTVTAARPVSTAHGYAVAYRWGGDAWNEVRRVTAWGEYSFAEHYMSGGGSYLPTGTYTVGFEYAGYCTQYWNGAASLAAATSFTPDVGTTQTGIDAVLSTGCASGAITPGTPTITGSTVVGQTLTAQPGTWAPDPVELSYQWLADGIAIDGATGLTLPLTDAQAGKTITVTVAGSRPGYTSAFATSAPVGPVTAEVVPQTPTIAGAAVAGATLTAQPGTWLPTDAALTYQWSAAGTAIAGATAVTFVPGDAEFGKTITVTVTGSKAGYTPASATSLPFGPITAAALADLDPGTPSISGTPQLGLPLTVQPGAWGPAPVDLAYQWLAGGETVAGATGTSYTPDAAAVGKMVSVIVRGSKPGYNAASAQAEPVGPVAPGELTPGEPTIGGVAQTDQPLTAVPGAWGPAPVDFTYQWIVDGEPVPGATGATFTPDATRVGSAVAVTVTGAKTGYTTQSRTSPTVTVAPGTLTASAPVVSGVVGVGRELSVDVSTWGPAPLDVAYQWLADGQPIEGATHATFAPDASLVGATIGITVTASRPGYTSETRSATAGVVPASVAVSEPRAQRGQKITVTGEFYQPNEEVLLELHSDPIELTRVTTDAEGRFSVEITIPAAAELADHQIVGTGLTSGLVGAAALTVYEPGTPPTPGPTPTPGASAPGAASTLSASGGNLPIAEIVIGIGLLVAGGLIVRRRRAMS